MKSAVRNLKRRLFYSIPGRYVLRRTACLGNAITKQAGLKSRVNHQKSRVDYLINIHSDRARTAQPEIVCKFIKNPTILRSIEDQEYDFFSYNKPKAIVMDSFSELTDQMFVHKSEGWQFLANYSDIDHTDDFRQKFRCEGLIPLNHLPTIYARFFDILFSHYPVEVLFLHFPTTLDKREKFQQRGPAIRHIIDDLSRKHPMLSSISIEDQNVDRGQGSDGEIDLFPYHFGVKTYQAFAQRLRDIEKL